MDVINANIGLSKIANGGLSVPVNFCLLTVMASASPLASILLHTKPNITLGD